MAKGREIRGKINSIKNTQKITRAMELVAASKMRKAQEFAFMPRSYAEKIKKVLSHVAAAHTEYHHPFLLERAQIKKAGFIVISTDRGLCGSLNINSFKKTMDAMKEWKKQKVDIDLCLIGHKAEVFFKRFGGNIVGQTSHLGDHPTVTQIIGVVKVMLDAYDQGQIDTLYVSYNKFVNTITQKPLVERLLPIKVDDQPHTEKSYWDYLYEPDAKTLLDQLLVRYIESQVYQAVVENVACAQAATMVAMKNATDNAGEIINELRLIYNKARQAAITQEISEIISGAAAV